MRVTMVMAITADGKIATVERDEANFGTADRARLETHCAGGDVLVMGAGALRSYRTTVPIRRPELLAARAAVGRPPQPVTCIVTRGADLDPQMPFFCRQEVPRLLVTPTVAAAAATATFGEVAEVWGCGDGEVDLLELVRRLEEAGHDHLILLGGGKFNAAWLAAGAPLDAIELTIAPELFGGATAPTLLDGEGLLEPCALLLTGVDQDEGLLFLSYRVLS